EADQQRRALGQAGIDAPGASAPGATRGLTGRPVVASGIEAVPRDIGLGIPGKPLALAVELAERGNLGRELERKAALDEPLLLRLIRAEQLCRVLSHLAHSPPSLRGRQWRGKAC